MFKYSPWELARINSSSARCSMEKEPSHCAMYHQVQGVLRCGPRMSHHIIRLAWMRQRTYPPDEDCDGNDMDDALVCVEEMQL